MPSTTGLRFCGGRPRPSFLCAGCETLEATYPYVLKSSRGCSRKIPSRTALSNSGTTIHAIQITYRRTAPQRISSALSGRSRLFAHKPLRAIFMICAIPTKDSFCAHKFPAKPRASLRSTSEAHIVQALIAQGVAIRDAHIRTITERACRGRIRTLRRLNTTSTQGNAPFPLR